MTIPNERCTASAHKLGELTARKITNAVAAINERLARTDGYPGGGERNGPRGSAETTATERAAMTRYALTTMREDLRDAITDACNTIDALDRMADDVLRFAGYAATPDEVPLCRDGQLGKGGVIEWGDATCCRLPVKGAMCTAHYFRWYRWRADHGVDTAKDFELAGSAA